MSDSNNPINKVSANDMCRNRDTANGMLLHSTVALALLRKCRLLGQLLNSQSAADILQPVLAESPSPSTRPNTKSGCQQVSNYASTNRMLFSTRATASTRARRVALDVVSPLRRPVPFSRSSLSSTSLPPSTGRSRPALAPHHPPCPRRPPSPYLPAARHHGSRGGVELPPQGLRQGLPRLPRVRVQDWAHPQVLAGHLPAVLPGECQRDWLPQGTLGWPDGSVAWAVCRGVKHEGGGGRGGGWGVGAGWFIGVWWVVACGGLEVGGGRVGGERMSGYEGSDEVGSRGEATPPGRFEMRWRRAAWLL